MKHSIYFDEKKLALVRGYIELPTPYQNVLLTEIL